MLDPRRPAARGGRRRARAIRGLALLAFVAAVSACESTVVSVVELSRLDLSPSTLTLIEGDAQKLAVVLTDADGQAISRAIVRWDVEDPEVVAVDPDGLVEALAPGRTTVRASSGEVSGSVQVMVLAGPAVELERALVEVEARAGDAEPVARSVEVGNAGNGVLDGLSARARTSEGETPSWLEAELLATTAPTELRLTLRAAELAPGTYEAVVAVESSASRRDAAEVRVRLRVGEPPRDRGDDEEEEDDDEEDDDRDDAPSCVLRNRVYLGTFDVPAGRHCLLDDVRILGSVRVRAGARLEARAVRIDGHLTAERASALVLTEVRVSGNLVHRNGGDATIRNSDLRRNVDLRGNRGRLELRENRVGRHLELRDNRGGPFVLVDNAVERRLECRGNRPEPVGGGNRADDGMRRQCRGM